MITLKTCETSHWESRYKGLVKYCDASERKQGAQGTSRTTYCDIHTYAFRPQCIYLDRMCHVRWCLEEVLECISRLPDDSESVL